MPFVLNDAAGVQGDIERIKNGIDQSCRTHEICIRSHVKRILDGIIRVTDRGIAPIQDIIDGAKMCAERQVGSFCVRPSDAALAAEQLKGSGVPVAVVVGFPHGANRPETKALEAKLAIEDGAAELDMVMNIELVIMLNRR